MQAKTHKGEMKSAYLHWPGWLPGTIALPPQATWVGRKSVAWCKALPFLPSKTREDDIIESEMDGTSDTIYSCCFILRRRDLRCRSVTWLRDFFFLKQREKDSSSSLLVCIYLDFLFLKWLERRKSLLDIITVTWTTSFLLVQGEILKSRVKYMCTGSNKYLKRMN